MNKSQRNSKFLGSIETGALSDKPVHRNQSFGDGIDGKEKTFKSHGAEQSRTIRRNEARGSDFSAVQSQPRFCDRPDISTSTGNHHTLRTCGFQIESVGERSWHDAKCGASVHKQFDFFSPPRGSGQTSFYVKQSHIKGLSKNMVIVARPTNNATMGKVSKVLLTRRQNHRQV
jgi:hypothetical protein